MATSKITLPCAKCGGEKDKPHSYCSSCRRDYHAEWYRKNRHKYVGKEPRTEYMRQWRYGITPAQFDSLLLGQGGHCALCKSTKNLHVDHCHATGKVRGVLCGMHNTALGKFGDSPEQLEAAAAYLRRTSGD